ncbi:MAG: PQQ-dependent sugar dehydrogenase [Anaerolineae bacterium]|nr:PQQ-dependent sugar dehydrogenase [Anaerolineae bacterium]NUQ06079.1 PQQ-dependent sugar dehydrogenase [Anaerolineae bacterium]
MPPCAERTSSLSEPWIREGFACLERVIDDASAGELGYTALASAPDGTLYAARPFAGQIIALTDGDGDGLPETPTVAADGLTLPNALAYDDGALYAAGGRHLYRLRDGDLVTLVDDLPTGEFWTGGVAVFEDRLYVGIGAACESCAADPESQHGTILSFALDGSDRRIEARGLRSPYALAVHEGALYITDSAPDALFDAPDLPTLDEVNRFTPGADYGFPACLGVGLAVDVRDAALCRATVIPSAALPTGSTPTGMASYAGGALPGLTGKLLVVLNGSRQALELRGYRLVAVDPQDGGMVDMMPAKPDDKALSNYTADQMNYRGSGFYPHRPIGVTVTDQGWIYLSVGGGRILALRP